MFICSRARAKEEKRNKFLINFWILVYVVKFKIIYTEIYDMKIFIIFLQFLFLQWSFYICTYTVNYTVRIFNSNICLYNAKLKFVKLCVYVKVTWNKNFLFLQPFYFSTVVKNIDLIGMNWNILLFSKFLF